MRPILNDIRSCEDYRASVRRKVESDDRLKERIHFTRCRLVALSSNYPVFLDYMRENEDILSQMDDAGKECMRRLCHDSMQAHAIYHSLDHIWYFDHLFGPYIPADRSHTIPVGKSPYAIRDDTPKTLDEQVIAYTNTTYQTFYDWISDPDVQARLAERPDLEHNVRKAIDTNRMHNLVMAPRRGLREYHPDDEALFAKVLDSMKDKRFE